MGIGDWGLGIGDWGLGIGPNPQAPIPNPHLNIFNIKKIHINKYLNINHIYIKILKKNELRCKLMEFRFI